jgi:CBS domain-containing protein
MKVKDVMTSEKLQYCSTETKLHNAAKVMKKANCGALPVLDSSRKVIGIVTDRDICLTLADRQIKPHAELNVGDIVSQKLYSVRTEDDLAQALSKMRTYKVGRLPVTDQSGTLQGMLTIHDLLSKSLNGQPDLGKFTATGENVAKTIKALADRYSNATALKQSATDHSVGRENWEE